MSAQMKIDQVGLPAGTPGAARTDGLATGALVTLTSVSGGTTARFRLLWVPPADTTAVPSLVQTGPTTWTFSPLAGVHGSYRIELIVDEGLPTESRQVRIFGIRTPAHALLVPAANERADAAVDLTNVSPTYVARSENNEAFGPFVTGSPWGWWKALADVIEAVGAVGSGLRSVTLIVGNALSGDTINNCDYLDPGDGTGILAAVAAMYGKQGIIRVRRGIYTMAANAPKITLYNGHRLIGEGYEATAIVCPIGDATRNPWETIELVGYGAEVSDMAFYIYDHGAVIPAITAPLGVIRVEAPATRVQRIACYVYPFKVTDFPLEFVAINETYTLKGQIIERVTIDMFSAVGITPNAGNPIAFIGFGSGGISAATVVDLGTSGNSPMIRECAIVSGKSSEAGLPYYTIGAAFSRTADVDLVDCSFEGVVTGFYGSWQSGGGFIRVTGPRIVRMAVRCADGLAASFIRSGVTIGATNGAGTLQVDRVHVEDLRSAGGSTGGAIPGLSITLGNLKSTDVVVRGVDARTAVAGASAECYLSGAGCEGAIVRDVILTAGAGGNGLVSINELSRALVTGCLSDQIDLGSSTNALVSNNRLRLLGGMVVGTATGYSLSNNPEG